MTRLSAFLLLIGLLLAACDVTEADLPESHFEASFEGPAGAESLTGAATVDSPESFDDELFFSVPGLPGSALEGKEITAISLTASKSQAEHEILFMRIADEAITAGETYELQGPLSMFVHRSGLGDFEPALDADAFKEHFRELPGEITTNVYEQATTDSVFAFMPYGGQLAIDLITDEEVAGTFSVEFVGMMARPAGVLPFEFNTEGDSVDPDDRLFRVEFFDTPRSLEGSFSAVPVSP